MAPSGTSSSFGPVRVALEASGDDAAAPESSQRVPLKPFAPARFGIFDGHEPHRLRGAAPGRGVGELDLDLAVELVDDVRDDVDVAHRAGLVGDRRWSARRRWRCCRGSPPGGCRSSANASGAAEGSGVGRGRRSGPPRRAIPRATEAAVAPIAVPRCVRFILTTGAPSRLSGSRRMMLASAGIRRPSSGGTCDPDFRRPADRWFRFHGNRLWSRRPPDDRDPRPLRARGGPRQAIRRGRRARAAARRRPAGARVVHGRDAGRIAPAPAPGGRRAAAPAGDPPPRRPAHRPRPGPGRCERAGSPPSTPTTPSRSSGRSRPACWRACRRASPPSTRSTWPSTAGRRGGGSTNASCASTGCWGAAS